METNILYTKLQNWIKTIKQALIGLKIAEWLFVILIGLASNKTLGFPDLWSFILVFSAIIWILINLIQILYEKNYPGSIVEELKSKSQVEEYEKSFARQKALNEFINSSIRALNDQTCSTGLPSSSHMCDEDLQKRLTDLYKPIINNTNTVLNAYDLSEFTIGLFLKSYLSEDNWDKDGIYSEDGIIILRDDLKLHDTIVYKDLMSNSNYTHSSLDIKSEIEKSLLNVEFVQKQIKIGVEKYSIICSDMPLFCSDEEASGVLFIILKGKYKASEDLPYILRIFNRLGANYIYKYNECVAEKISNKMAYVPPPLKPTDVKKDVSNN